MIPLVLVLWEFKGFQGKKRVFVADTPDLRQQLFDNKGSSLAVHRGPDFDAWTKVHGEEPWVVVYSKGFFEGKGLGLHCGGWPDADALDFDDNVSSLKFEAPLKAGDVNPPASASRVDVAPCDRVPLVAEFFAGANFVASRIVMIDDTASLRLQYGPEFNDSTTSIRVTRGPSYAGEVLRLFTDENFGGRSVDLAPGEYKNLSEAPAAFNDACSSAKILLA